MNRVLIPFAGAIALLIPILCHSKDVSIPEVGIDLANAPDKTSAPVVDRETDGTEGIVRIGEAVLVIYRGSKAVAPGAAVTDEGFRASLKSLPNLVSRPQSKGRLTLLAGRPAWTYFDAYAVPSLVDYVLEVYAIVDEHLYIMQVEARTSSKKHPDFEAAVGTLQNARFSMPGKRGMQPQNSPSPSGLRLPPFLHGKDHEDFYPPIAQRLGQEGEVDLQFRIDRRGRPRDLQQTYAVALDLGEAAEHLIKTLAFDVPRDWGTTGSDQQRFNMEIQFTLRCYGHPASYPPRVAGAEVISICVTRKQ